MHPLSWSGPRDKKIHLILAVLPVMLLAVSSLFAIPNSVKAAEIAFFSDPDMGCDIQVSGLIETGDAEALRDLIDQSDQRIALEENRFVGEPLIGSRPPTGQRVCFDSPGGSFVEGLNIAKVLIEYRKGSAVAAGMVCESACALAFMGGSLAQAHVEGSDNTDRVLHPKGLLGFHAPTLTVPGGQYNEAEVEAAYRIALSALEALLKTRSTVNRSFVGGTDQTASFRYQFSDSLLLEMLGTASNQMRYVNTIGEASRWDIRIAPVRLPHDVDHYKIFSAACDNMLNYWSESTVFFFEKPPFLDAQDGMFGFEVEAATAVDNWSGAIQPLIRLIAVMGPYSTRCDIEVFETSNSFFDPLGMVTHNEREFFYPFQTFEPNTEIRSLAPQSQSLSDLNTFRIRLYEEVENVANGMLASCWLTKNEAQISNVDQFVNLRSRPTLTASVVREVPLGESVLISDIAGLTGVGAQSRRDACGRACNDFQQNSNDTDAKDIALQCINENVLWTEITDARGNRGWVSRKFLQDFE